MAITESELQRRFNHHPPVNQEKVDRHERVRQVLRQAAREIIDLTGEPTREQSLSITALEESMMWANAAIAREGVSLSPTPITPDPGKHIR